MTDISKINNILSRSAPSAGVLALVVVVVVNVVVVLGKGCCSRLIS